MYTIQKYSGFSRFKRDVGNVNQFIISALIGINKISETDRGVNEPAPWNPKNVVNAKARSREFVIKSGLTWSITCLDVLLKDFFLCFFSQEDIFYYDKDENICCDEKTKDVSHHTKKDSPNYNEIYRSVYNKFSLIKQLIKNVDPNELLKWRQDADYRVGNSDSDPFFPDCDLVFALVDLGIQWRNVLIHEGVDNSISQESLRVIAQYSDLLNTNEYGTLESERIKESFRCRKTPSFKEVTVLIRNMIDFGYILNAYWVNMIDKSTYLYEKMLRILPGDVSEVEKLKNSKNENDNKRAAYYSDLYSLEEDRRINNVCMRLMEFGLNNSNDECTDDSEEEKCIKLFLNKLYSC